MFRWGIDGSGVGFEELNSSLAAYDAIVDSGIASATGQIYPTVTAALADEARSILVLDGVHSPFTLSVDGVTIHGLRKPLISGGVVTTGPRFTGGITINSKRNRIARLGMNISSGIALQVNEGRYQIIEECAIAGADQLNAGGINFNAPAYDTIIRGNEITGVSNGILVQPAASEEVDGVSVLFNWIHEVGGVGIGIMDSAGTDNVNDRNVLVLGNRLKYPAQRYGQGILVEAAASAQVIANHVSNAGSVAYNTSGAGIYVQVPPASPYLRSIIEANKVYGSRGYGIASSAATSRVVLNGNFAVGNASGNYSNCGSCPGYVIYGSGTNGSG